MLVSEPSAYPGIVRAAVDLLLAPSRLFGALRDSPKIRPPLIVIVIGTALLSLTIVTGPLLNDIRAQLETTEMPREQMAVILEKMGGTWGYLTALFPTIAAGVLPFLIAGVFALFLTITRAMSAGPAVPYRSLVSLAAHVSLIDFAEFVVKLPLYFAKGTLHVYSSLALLLPEDASDTRLFTFLNAFEAFTIWKLVLYTIGISVIAERGRTASAMLVWLPWLLWVLGRTALHGVFSGGPDFA